jgi:hypothetical protein
MTREEGADMCSTYLGVSPGVVMTMFDKLGGPYLKLKFLGAVYIDNWDYDEKAIVEKRPMHEIRLFRERAIRAFLLFLVGCTIFSNKSNYYVEVVYLQFFQDLSTVHQWNWGAAALCHLQMYLEQASWAKTTQMAGYMSFLQVQIYVRLSYYVTYIRYYLIITTMLFLSLFQGWIIVHFPRLSVWGTDTSYEDHMGWNAYFVPGQGHKECDGYRLSLDNIQMSDCVFSPYDGRRHVRPLINACWFSGWIRDGDVRGKHLPERVLRQFKFVQGIPRHPSTAATPGMNLFEIDRVWMEELELRMIDEDMRGPAVVNP